MKLVLNISDTAGRGRRLRLRESETLEIGRSIDSDICLPEDDDMSTRHFEVVCASTGCTVRDLGSEFGTFLNGSRIVEAILSDGDLLTAGQTSFEVQLDDGEARLLETKPESNEANLPSEVGLDGFYLRLYLEHLEEVSFLYYERLVLLRDDSISWLDVQEWDERIEAHLDSLVVGDDFALRICRNRALEGDDGEFHAAIRVFCRQRRHDLLDEAIGSLDPEDFERINAAADALRDEFPEEWDDILEDWLTDKPKPFLLTASKLVHLRGQAVGGNAGDLGFRPDPQAIVALRGMILSEDDFRLQQSSAVSALQVGDANVLQSCAERIAEDWALRPSGLAGSTAHVTELIERTSKQPHADGLLALGLLGDARAFETLCDALPTGHGAEAALALFLLTGAPLTEEVEERQQYEEEDLFPHELVQLERGEFRPPGTKITRLARCQNSWRGWWKDNRERFTEGKRYCVGQLVTPQILVSLLFAHNTPNRIRLLIFEQLAIRYNLSFAFDVEMTIALQIQAAQQVAAWLETNGERFEPGEWYFAGQSMK